jgi:hypothetical protein
MTVNDNKAKITGRIWQSIAQSGIQVSAIPKEQLDALVNALADGVLTAQDDLLADVGLPQRPATSADATGAGVEPEKMLWKGRPWLSLVEYYEVTSERLLVITGFFGRDHEDVELVRLQDIDFRQSFWGRLFNRGTIFVRSADASHPVIKLKRISGPAKVHQIIWKAMLSARRRYRFSFQEEMTTTTNR